MIHSATLTRSGPVFQDAVIPRDVSRFREETQRRAFVLTGRTAIGHHLEPRAGPAIEEGRRLAPSGRHKRGRTAKLVGRAPQEIDIQRLVEKLDDFRPLIDQDDDLQQLVLDQQSVEAVPRDLVVDPAAPVSIRAVRSNINGPFGISHGNTRNGRLRPHAYSARKPSAKRTPHCKPRERAMMVMKSKHISLVVLLGSM